MTHVITTLFLDIGGVLLTNGWDRHVRARAEKEFGLDPIETEERHHLTWFGLEEDKISMDEYLDRTIFFKERDFTKSQFIEWVCTQTKELPHMIPFIKQLKEKHCLKIAVISNESRVLNNYRIQTFQLGSFVDFFISSCFVHCRKPDREIYRIALDLAQVQPDNVLYIEDTPMFVQVAQEMGIRSIVHSGFLSTKETMMKFNFQKHGLHV